LVLFRTSMGSRKGKNKSYDINKIVSISRMYEIKINAIFFRGHQRWTVRHHYRTMDRYRETPRQLIGCWVQWHVFTYWTKPRWYHTKTKHILNRRLFLWSLISRYNYNYKFVFISTIGSRNGLRHEVAPTSHVFLPCCNDR